MKYHDVLVSIIIGTKNREKVLPRAIDSALKQTHTNIECIIIDASNNVETQHIVNSYTDKRIRYYHLNPDPGRLSTIKYGIEVSSGEYICFLDDDDLYYPNKVEKQLEVFVNSEEELGIVYSWGKRVDEQSGDIADEKNSIRGNVYKHTLSKMSLCSFISLMIPRGLIANDLVFDGSCKGIISDWYYINKLTRFCKVDYVPEYLFEIHVNHMYDRISDTQLNESDKFNKILEFHRQFLSDNADGFALYPKSTMPHILSIITSSGCLGEIELMFKYYLQGLMIMPFEWKLHRRFIGSIYRIATKGLRH